MTIAIITEAGVRKVAPMTAAAQAAAASAALSAGIATAVAQGRYYASYAAGNAATTTGQYFAVFTGGNYSFHVNGNATPVFVMPKVDTSGNMTLTGAGNQVFNMTGPKADFGISVDGTNNAGGTTITYSWAAGGQGPLKFANASGEVARFDPAGNFQIGTTSIGAGFGFGKCTVNGNTDAALLAKTINTGLAVGYFWNAVTTGDPFFLGFLTEGGAGTSRGGIQYNRGGGTIAYNTTSDYRSKDVFGEFEGSGAMIDALTVHRGRMKGATLDRPMLIAHELQEVAPWAATGEKDAESPTGEPIYQQVDHQILVPLLIAEIQSLRARIAAIEAALSEGE